ncbi:MAG: ABC transporter ATP-binding protein [Endomicrobium sp.]|jgi:iron complex transport system ATP-binding protein|nr:ABC transporter ATP-binding protein [Endomicrobium sp.]
MLIQIKNVSAGYVKKYLVLKNINCNIKLGEFIGIIGKNGVGKSTFLKLICCLIKPFSGTVLFRKRDIFTLSKDDLSRIISFLPQQNSSDTFNNNFSVLEFIMLGRFPYYNKKILKIPSNIDFKIVKKITSMLFITDLLHRKMNTLSGGEKQKVLIAQVLVQETKVLIFDEPTSNLDIGNQINILLLLKKINKDLNKTIIVSIHDLNIASEFCNKLILLNNKTIYRYGVPRDIINYNNISSVFNIKNIIIKINHISNKPYIIIYKHNI